MHEPLPTLKPLSVRFLNRSEPATVKRGLQTWQELRLALSGSDDVGVDAHFLAQFARESPAPSRVYHALRWLGRNFPLSMDLALLVPPTKQKGGRYGGGRQAPVVPPPIIHFLDDLLSTGRRLFSMECCALSLDDGFWRGAIWALAAI